MNILIKINKKVSKHAIGIEGNFDITISNTPVRNIRHFFLSEWASDIKV